MQAALKSKENVVLMGSGMVADTFRMLKEAYADWMDVAMVLLVT